MTAHSAKIYIDRELGPCLTRRYATSASHPAAIADVTISLNPHTRIHLMINRPGSQRTEESLRHDTPAASIANLIAHCTAVPVTR